MNKKYTIYTPFSITRIQLDDYKNQINSFYKDKLEYVNDLELAEYIFVFGGDGTFIKSMNDLVDYHKKIILISTTRLGFLSSLLTLDNCIFNDNLYQLFNYLNVTINSQTFKVINEIKINTNKINSITIYINNSEFKKVLSDEIEICNNIGSTGINRSKNRPIIFPNSKNYLFSVNNEPIYQYNTPLLQPVLIDINSELILEYNNSVSVQLKIDNNLYHLDDINQIQINQTESKLKILNFGNLTLFFNKIKSLL